MIYLLLSIFCSVTVGVLLKISKNKGTNIFQMVSVNYLIALVLCYNLFPINLNTMPSDLPWPVLIPLSLLLPTIFVILFHSVNRVGIIKTDIAQRLSLVIPIVAAILIFQEQITTLKYIGLGFGLLAIYFTLNKKDLSTQNNKNSYIFPLFVFLGFGVIDVFFKQIALYTTLPYTTSLFFVFACSLLVSILINAYQILTKRNQLSVKNLYYGLPLGVLNFLNIYFYLKAHTLFSDNPTTVFAMMNFGVIILGTLIGVIGFKERLSRKNILGLILAIVAISLIATSQYLK
ncbi:DMT family transporter [Flavobacterium sp. HSC-61S13]|uniref:DMT family transporter n=1 Tax=Flavobacterium sp. HSC-61S13 TaxID=2910963 RepID=UPI00209E6F32|nr:DMT family transporter [Flavobacterium sp. HSC-61S13]MCP1994721.1 drug/metabolite transporter (DMT)-like permease [Flavobacterium sp. HSC-61S13]